MGHCRIAARLHPYFLHCASHIMCYAPTSLTFARLGSPFWSASNKPEMALTRLVVRHIIARVTE